MYSALDLIGYGTLKIFYHSPCIMLTLVLLGYGVGYAWDCTDLDIKVGDTVRWEWKSPDQQSRNLQGYRIEQTDTPTSTSYTSGFKSSDTPTKTGKIE